jgi:hypothetical protein
MFNGIKIKFKDYLGDTILSNETLNKYIKNRVWFGWYFENNKWDPFVLKRVQHKPVRRRMCITFNRARKLILNSVSNLTSPDITIDNVPNEYWDLHD